MKIKIDKHYTYKGNEYKVVGFTDMKVSGAVPDWQPGVLYKSITAGSEVSPYSRLESQFLERFIPTTLEVGDEIVGQSMGKIIRTYKVSEIDEAGFAHYDNSTLITDDSIDINGKIESLPDDETVTAEYYYLSVNLDIRLKNLKVIQDLSVMFYEASESFSELSVSSIDFNILEEYKKEGEQLINKILNVYGNK